MKPIIALTNTERAKMLVDLHPSKRVEIVDYIEKVTNEIIENEEEYRKNWDNTALAFDFWLSEATNVSNLIRQKKVDLKKSNTIFSDQLFYNYRAIISNHCICEMAKNQSDQPEFCLTVALLYFYSNQYKLILNSNGDH